MTATFNLSEDFGFCATADAQRLMLAPKASVFFIAVRRDMGVDI
jgi:hypothetical protein